MYYVHDKIKYIRNSKNRGPGVSRGLGMQAAKGDYIVFLDSDDYWDKNFLKTCINTFQNNENDIVMVYTNTLGFNKNKFYGNKKYQVLNDTKILPIILQRGRPWETSACMWNLKKIKGLPWIKTRNWEDYAFDVIVAVKYNDVLPINKNLVYYDEDGDDKLSLQDASKTSIEKSKSLNYISETLKHSEFAKDKVINKQIVLLLINSIIALNNAGVSNVKYINKNIRSLNNWKGVLFTTLIKLVCFTPIKVRLILLRKIKNKIQG